MLKISEESSLPPRVRIFIPMLGKVLQNPVPTIKRKEVIYTP